MTGQVAGLGVYVLAVLILLAAGVALRKLRRLHQERMDAVRADTEMQNWHEALRRIAAEDRTEAQARP